MSDIAKHAATTRIEAALEHLAAGLGIARRANFDVTIYVVPTGEYDLPTVGVRLSQQGPYGEEVVWIGMPVPPLEED